MKKRHAISLAQYSLLFLSVLLVDRITKNMALCYLHDRIQVNSFLSYDLVLNRGISWGIFHDSSNYLFLAVSVGIACIIAGVGFYTFIKWMNREYVIGELLVLAGATSNLLDRILYHGVVDFILCSCGSWSWPVFNVADACIVIGVGIMLIESYSS